MKSKMQNRRNVVRGQPRTRSTKPVKQAEIGLLGRALRSLGSAGGSMLGSAIGFGGAGSAAGHSLGAAVSKWLGAGDYQVNANSILKSSRASPSVPMMHTTNQTVVVRHREYIAQIKGSTAFTVQASYQLNPGLINTFPWLSGIATNFQEYTIKGMVFHYVPTSGNAVSATNGALGSVMIQTTYRSTDSAPSTKVEMLNEYWACESVPSETFCHPIECDPKENPFNVQYIRKQSVPTGDSQLMYDLGTTYVATSGQQADGFTLGDLWVTYEVELRKPLISSNVTTATESYRAKWVGGTIAATTGSIFPTDSTSFSSSGLLPVTASLKRITIPANLTGTFYVSAVVGSNAGVNGALNFDVAPTLTNCTVAQYYIDGDTWGDVITSTTTARLAFFQVAVTKVDSTAVAYIDLNAFTVGGAGVLDYTNLSVYRLPL